MHKRSIATALGLAWFCFGCQLIRRAPDRPRAIVLISIDTVRADHLRPYGGQVAVPALEALAADGILFERAYAHSPQTFPSHTAVLSGVLPADNGVRDNVGFTVSENAPLLASRLKQAGYATGAAVSSYVLRRETGLDRGFDWYESSLTIQGGPDTALGQVQRAGSETIAKAQEWIAAHAREPFFFFLHLYEPHSPYTPPSPYRERYRHPYDGELAYADALAGGFISFLKGQRLYDDALLVLMSDHGEGLGDHGEEEHGIFLYQSTTHVPLIVKLPLGAEASAKAAGRARAGSRVADAVQLIDIAPTVASTVRFTPAPEWKGVPLIEPSARSSRRTASAKATAVRSIYAESMYPRYHFGWKELYSLTDERFRYILAPREELYDLQADAREERNLAAEASRASTRDAMRGALAAMVRATTVAAPRDVSPQDLEKFQALGYIGMQASSVKLAPDTLPDPKDKIGIFAEYRRAIELARENNVEGAIRLYRQIVADNPAMIDVWDRLAQLLLRSGRDEEASLVLRRVLDLAPANTTARLQLGRVLLRAKRYDESAALAKEAASREPARGYELLGRIAYERGNVEEADRYAEKTIQLSPELPLPYYIRGLLHYRNGRLEQALALFEQAAEKLKARPGVQLGSLYLHLGDTYARLGRAPEAERAFLEELKYFPNNLDARAKLAALYRAAGQEERARMFLKRKGSKVP